jgi:hypothetical protein
MEGFLPIFFLLVVLKIPVLGALWLIWWAAKAPEAAGSEEDSNGGSGGRRPRQPILPLGPRRGPAQAACGERLRSRRISRM